MARRRRKKRHHPKKHNISSYLQEALILLRQGELNAASHLASQVMQLATNNALQVEQAQSILTEIHFRHAINSQDIQKKLTHLDTALKLSPKDNRFHFHRGITLLQTGNAAEALKEFDLAAKIKPAPEGLAYFRQLARLANKKTLEKDRSLSAAETHTLKLVEEFQKRPAKKALEALVEEPVLGHPQMWKALLHMRQNKEVIQTETLKECANSHKHKPVSAILLYYQGISAMREEKLDAAHDLWRNALSNGAATKWSQKNIALSMHQEFLDLFEARRWEELMKKFQRLPLALNDESLNQIISLTLFHLGYEYAQKSKWQQAVKYWTDASHKANNRYLAQNMALAQEKLERWTQAADAWRDMLRRRPRKEDHADYLTDKQVSTVWAHIASCYWDAYKDKDALESFRKAIQYDPENLELRFKLISQFMAKGRGNQEAAIKELNNILQIAPENIEALTQLAHFYKKNWKYDPIPLWRKIIELEPENTEVRKELAQHYINKALPPKKQGIFFWKSASYKRRVEILQEGLNVLPDHPDLVVTLGIAHMDAKKKTLAKEQFLRAYQIAPQNTYIVSVVLQNLVQLKEDTFIEKMIPEIHTIPGLLPGFWVDQGNDALKHSSWAQRFFDEALEQLNYTNKTTKAGVLVDIYMCLPPDSHQSLRDIYMKKIKQEVPRSGALEYLEGFLTFSQTHNTSKARRLLRKAKNLANAANDTGVLGHIEAAERMLSMPAGNLIDILSNMDEGMLEEMMEDMGGFDDEAFF